MKRQHASKEAEEEEEGDAGIERETTKKLKLRASRRQGQKAMVSEAGSLEPKVTLDLGDTPPMGLPPSHLRPTAKSIGSQKEEEQPEGTLDLGDPSLFSPKV